jgi:hypothetical protein
MPCRVARSCDTVPHASRAAACLAVVAACGYPKLERLCTADDPPGAACVAPDDAGIDAACPSLHAMQPHATPSVELLIDRSASMASLTRRTTRSPRRSS